MLYRDLKHWVGELGGDEVGMKWHLVGELGGDEVAFGGGIRWG